MICKQWFNEGKGRGRNMSFVSGECRLATTGLGGQNHGRAYIFRMTLASRNLALSFERPYENLELASTRKLHTKMIPAQS